MPNYPNKNCPGEPRRILYLITDLDIGGAEKCCAELAIGLDRTRWQPTVCSIIPPGAMADRLDQAGIPVHSLDARRATHAPRTVFRLARLLQRIRPTVLHSFLFHANVIGRLTGRLAGTPHIVSSIRVAEQRYRYHLVIENLTCRLSDRIVCVSEAVCDHTRLKSHVPRGRLSVIPNGIRLVQIEGAAFDRGELGVPPDGIIALYAGRLDEQKGVDVLLRALAFVQSSDPRLHLVVAGAGALRQSLVDLAGQLGVAPRTHFIGWRADILELMRAADFFVLPSRWEGMPNVLLEAMSVGLPVIATRAQGSTELVRDGESGTLVGIDRADELARAMQSLTRDSALRGHYGRNGQEIAQREFSLDRMIERYSQLYDSLH